ncbi:MAG TPA: hemerythrin domain-containing protein [Thermoleophilia bacterium]|jgi:hemerythrin-like domain-containing protein|nr:hemerythrin domain-containing protein [Thermoleophilia bacterium]
MCEYCGCQEVPALGELTREHDRVVDLIGDVRTAHRDGDVERMAHLAHRIADLLAPHTVVEEEGLFPPLEGDFPEQMAELRGEHRTLEAVVSETCVAASWDEAWATRLLSALDLLRWHILKEQDGVFPAALATLRTADWEAVDAVRDRVGSKLPHPAAM